jgi:hypothetical protein
VHVGEGVAGYNNMVNAFQHNMRASYLRIIMINPLHERVPSVIAMMQATCNRFSKGDVDDQWRRFRVLYNVHLRPVLGMLVGPGSDGDERRFTLQRASMTSRDGDRYRSASRVFRLTGLRDPTTGDVSCVPSQDTFHAVKKLEGPMDNSSRDMAVGRYLNTWWHINMVGDPDLFDQHEHGTFATIRIIRLIWRPDFDHPL